MKKINCKVILCGPAVGKTYLSNLDDRFVDIDGEKSKYKYNLYGKTYEEIERNKGNRGKVIKHDSIEYSIRLLKKIIQSNKIALITYNDELIGYLIKNNIDYCMVYADISLRQEYKQRMLDRGNGIKFADEMTNIEVWNKFYISNESDNKPKYKIKLKSGEYLSDYKDYFV